MSSRRTTAAVAGAAGALAVAIGLWVAVAGGDDDGQQRRAEPTHGAQDPQPELTGERADEIAAQLSSGNEAQLREALVLPAGQQLDPALAEQLRSTSVRLDPASFRSTGADTATAQATTTGPDGAAERWTVLLLAEDGQWKVLSTRPAQR